MSKPKEEIRQGRAYGQRLKLFYLRHYFLENTDEEHGVTITQVQEHMKSKGIGMDRKTFYSDVKLLSEGDHGEDGSIKNPYPIDIEFRPITQDYRVYSRDFELYELQLLIDSVQSSKFITERKAKVITEKLRELTSRHNRYLLDRRSYVTNRIRNQNESIFNDIDNIHVAIHNNNKIEFKYFSYNLKKEKEYYKKDYTVSPFALLWNDDKYYLLAFDGEIMKHFRVDKMESIKERSIEEMKKIKRVLDEDDKREGHAEFKALKISERQSKIFSMFGGVEERVRLRFTNNLIGVALDRFGKDIPITSCDSSHFETSVVVEVSPIFFGWLCGFGKQVKVVSPDNVAREFSEYVGNIANMYQDVTEN